ncbi:condensation domain-containing protein [Roseibium aggregatum]|uniref:condensation domain-containing protein n=1 Tax=Roseibium aggregatum TaxID=187304 RepID=UPI0025ABCF6B|nr:condensation domain-containing protein [Roseibium aggregatum]WJS06052.1 condensation domain-containing protein [Roseibium aggregatum]
MTGGFDRLLTATEFERFDAELKSLDRSTQPAVPAGRLPKKGREPRTVTQHQERIWLAQQQDPDKVLRHAQVYRLGGTPDIARLARAVDTLVEALPELAMRYCFSDEGELVKSLSHGPDGTLEIIKAENQQEAVSLVLAAQKAHWDSEAEPPFKVLLILCGQAVILGLLMHRILEEVCSPEDVLRSLVAAYDGKVIAAPALRQAKQFEPDFPGLAPVTWLRRGEGLTDTAVIDFNGTPGLLPTGDRLALRFGTLLEPVLHHDQDYSSSDHTTLLAEVGVRFAQFLCKLGGHERIEAIFLAWQTGSLTDPCGGFARSDSFAVSVGRDMAPEEGERQVLSHLNAISRSEKHDNNTLAADVPKVWIQRLADPKTIVPTDTLAFDRIPLPTYEARPDFELAVGFDTEGRAILELVTGQRIRRHAGSLVLDLFSGYLRNPEVLSIAVSQQLLQSESARVSDASLHAGQGTSLDVTAIQAAILQEFRDALAVADLTPDDDFFDFGGHSLVATRIIGRLLHDHGIEVRFNDLFGNPTAAGLARHATLVDTAGESTGNHNVEIRNGKASDAATPLALAQMSLWKIYSALGYREIFNLPFALDFLDPVDETVFEAAFGDLMKRHAALRTLYFETEEGDVLQKVVPVEELATYKWFWTSTESTGADRNAEAIYCFDLAKELPVRLRFLTDPETGRQVLSFLFHHLALDEWSVNLMMDELVEAYRARSLGVAPEWPDEPAPFHEFARKQVQLGVKARHLAFWTDMLGDAPRELVLFTNEPKLLDEPATDDCSVAGGWVEMRLESDVSDGLYAIAKENSASLFNVVYGAISAALQALGGLSDLVIGTSAAGRTDPDYFDTIGYFTTVVAHRVRFGDDPTVGTLIGNIKDMINGSMPFTDIPIDLVEDALGMTPGMDHLFDVFIQIHAQNKLNGNLPAPDGGTIAFRQVDPDKHESHLGLQFEVMEEVIDGNRAIRVLMSYQARRYSPAQVEAIRASVMSMFTQFSRGDASNMNISQLART